MKSTAAKSPPAKEPEPVIKARCPVCGGLLQLVATATSKVRGDMPTPEITLDKASYELRCMKADFSLKRTNLAVLLREFGKQVAA